MVYRFSDDTAEMDRAWIHAWLSNESYWARGRTRETHDRAMDNSRNFGMFDPDTGQQVAYARLITDTVTFGWLCDVFVTDALRGQGVGVKLIEHILAVIEPWQLKRVGLTTADAHGLYARFGFGEVPNLDTWMVRAVDVQR
ncbi:GNAT family N-acetyltransferase [soil metagenome]